MIKPCARCGRKFRGHGNAKYCSMCRHVVFDEQHLAYERRRGKRKKSAEAVKRD